MKTNKEEERRKSGKQCFSIIHSLFVFAFFFMLLVKTFFSSLTKYKFMRKNFLFLIR